MTATFMTLKPRERQVLRAAWWAARECLGEGRYLPSSGEQKAALRLIERQFLMQLDSIGLGDPKWVTVTITGIGVVALQEAAKGEQAVRADDRPCDSEGSAA